MLAIASALAAMDARRDIRWLGVACAGAVGLLPGAGASTGWFFAILATLGSAAAVQADPAWVVLSGVVAAALIGTCLFGALASFRVYDAAVRAAARQPIGTGRVEEIVSIVLGVVALLGGVVLGAGTTVFGGHVTTVATRLAGPSSITAPPSLAFLALVLSLVAAASGVGVARHVSVKPAAPAWLRSLDRPYDVLGWTAHGLGVATSFLQRSVRALDRDVIDDVPAAMRETALRAFRSSRALGSGAPVTPPKHDPSGAEKAVQIRMAALFVMVALLGLVVLSSLLLT